MSQYVIYQSNKRNSDRGGKTRSDAIAADNVKARTTLERAGWTVVETFEREDAPEPTASNLPRIAQELLAVEQGEVELAWEDAEAPEEVTEPTEVEQVDFWGKSGVTDAQRRALTDAMLGSEDALRAASDARLQEVDGIGAATVRNLRKALKAEA